MGGPRPRAATREEVIRHGHYHSIGAIQGPNGPLPSPVNQDAQWVNGIDNILILQLVDPFRTRAQTRESRPLRKTSGSLTWRGSAPGGLRSRGRFPISSGMNYVLALFLPPLSILLAWILIYQSREDRRVGSGRES